MLTASWGKPEAILYLWTIHHELHLCSVHWISCMINGHHLYTTLLVVYLRDVFLAKRIILNMSHLYCWWCLLHMPNKHSVSNLYQLIHCSMVHCTSLIWSDHNLCHFTVHGMVNCTNLIWSYCNLCHFTIHGMVNRTNLIWSYCNLCHSFFMIWLSQPYQPNMECQ